MDNEPPKTPRRGEDENFGYPPDEIIETEGAPFTPEAAIKPEPVVVSDNPLVPIKSMPGRPTKNTYPFFELEPDQGFELDITGKDSEFERVNVMNGTRRKGLRARRFSSSIVAEGGKIMLKVWRTV